MLALSLKRAAKMIEEETLHKIVEVRYAGWNGELGQQILQGQLSLEQLARLVQEKGFDPKPVSGQQEYLENIVNQVIYR